MTKTFSAIFENGVLRPVEPVDFPEHCQVRVLVQSVQAANDEASLDDVYAVLSKRFNSGEPAGNDSQATSPVVQRVRLVGRLTAVRAEVFDLVLDDGQSVSVRWVGGEKTSVSGLNDERALVLGTAIFDSAGKLLRIDADDIARSTDESCFFSTIPRLVSAGLDLDDVRREQRQKSGLMAIIGQWPGDETDEEVTSALRELS